MRPAAKKSGCRVHIKKKCGVPFLLYRFKRRKGFKTGLLIFASLLVLSMSIIWDIEIIGCESEMIPKVMNVLNVDNIGRGSFKMKLNPKDIASKIALNVDQIAWAGVEIKGVKLFITIKDSIDAPVLINNNESFNIIAERDGLVKNMEVYAGNALVKEGETVRKGQVLVSGKLESKNPEFGSRDIHALGKIMARTWYENSLPVSKVYTQRLKTGKTHEIVYLRFLDSRLKISGGNLPYEMFDTVTIEKPITGPFGLKIPIGLTVEKSSEIIEKKIDLTSEEALIVATETAKDDLLKRIPKDCTVVDEIVKQYNGDNNTVYIQVVFECEEDIAGLEPVLQ
jgi:similar to stage IV sporulation protein